MCGLGPQDVVISGAALEMNLSRICQEVIKAVDAGCQVIVLSVVVYLGDCHDLISRKSE